MEEYEPWEFREQPCETPLYWNEPDLVQEAHEGNPQTTDLLLKKWMCTGSQYNNGVHKMWCEYEEDLHKWKEEELEFEHEELKHEHEELACEPPPPVPTDTTLPPPPTYETTIGHQLTSTPYVIT